MMSKLMKRKVASLGLSITMGMGIFMAPSMQFIYAKTKDSATPIQIEKWGKVDEKSDFIQSEKLQVIVDKSFPRVIQYQYIDTGAILYGQEDLLTKVVINNKEYTPQVEYQKKSDSAAEYLLSIDEINVKMTMEIDINENILEFKVTSIEDTPAFRVKKFDIPDHSLVSIRSNQTGATETGIDVKGTINYSDNSREERNPLSSKSIDTKPVNKSYVMLNTDELAAAVYSNAINTYVEGASNKNIANQNETRVVYQTEQKDQYKKMGAWSYPWTYRELDDEEMELPFAKVIITGDANKNGNVDWQDGSIAYREIIEKPYMYEEAKKSIFHIAYTRASLAQWPFLKTLDMVKKLNLYTDGFQQFLQYKGYQAEGHDSNHPDYGNNIGAKVGGIEDFNKLVDEALNYNCYVGVHLNHTEAYPEAEYYTYDLVTNSDGWNSLDQAKIIDRYKDAVNNGYGGLQYRLDELKTNVPNLQWIYYDVYSGQGYAEWKLATETLKPFADSKGLAVATEFHGALDKYSIWNHVQKNESPALRMIKYGITDQFYYDPILLESRHAGAMGYGNDGNEDQGTTGQTIPDQIDIFYKNNLIFKYLQNHDILEMTLEPGSKYTQEVRFEDNMSAKIVGEEEVTRQNSYEIRKPVVELRKEGQLVARYQNEFKRKLTANGSYDSAKYITPMLTQYLIPWEPETEEKLYHYNSEGGKTTWSLPNSWEGQEKVQLFELSDLGKSEPILIDVVDGQVEIDAKANTPYIIYKEGEEGTVKSADEMNWGDGSYFKDPGFEEKTFTNWEVSPSVAANQSVTIETSPASGETYVQMKGQEELEIAQQITGLVPGKKYQVSAWVEVDDRTATLGIRGVNTGEETNEMYESKIKNNYYNTLRYNDSGNKMQRLKLEFIAQDETIEVFIKGNEGQSENAYVKVDDFRLYELKRTTEGAQKQIPEDAIFFEDFETANDEGWGPFVPVQNVNRAHLSEAHMGYTYDTIDGKYSFKIRESVGPYNKGEAVRTIGSNVRLENGKTYTLQFKYWIKTKDSYDIAISTGYGTNLQDGTGGDRKDIFREKVDYNNQFYSKTFTVPNDGREYGISIIKNITDKHEFILDDIALYEGIKECPEQEIPTYDFEEGNISNWKLGYGNGFATLGESEGDKSLKLVTDRYPTIALDEQTNDIQDGEVSFTTTPNMGEQIGVVVRYTDPNNYLKVAFESKMDGWRYTSYKDGEETTGIINLPGLPLNKGYAHDITFKYEGNRYTLVVDGIPLFDGVIEGLIEEAGRVGFAVKNKTEVLIDNVLIKGEQAEAGTEIVHYPAVGNEEEGMVSTTLDDSYVRDGGYSNNNFGAEGEVMVKNDGVGYSREAYLKFKVPEVAVEDLERAEVDLYMTMVGSAAPNQALYLVEDNWNEKELTWNNKPSTISEITTIQPKEGSNKIDLTDCLKQAIQEGKKEISIGIKASEKIGGSSDIRIAAFEYYDDAKQPKLRLDVKEVPQETGMTLKTNELVEGNKTFDVLVGMNNIKEALYAQDIRMQYDKELFEVVAVEGIDPTMVVKYMDSEEGKLRILTANDKGIKKDEDTVRVKIRAKNVNEKVEGTIQILDSETAAIIEGTTQIITTGPVKTKVTVMPGSEEVDKTSLEEAIKAAEKLVAEAVVGDRPGEYPAKAKKALEQSVVTAKEVLQNATTQTEINETVDKLNEAMKTFKESVVKGDKEDINQDGRIDVADLALVAYYYQAKLGDANWEVAKKADIDGNDIIDLTDLARVANEILEVK